MLLRNTTSDFPVYFMESLSAVETLLNDAYIPENGYQNYRILSLRKQRLWLILSLPVMALLTVPESITYSLT